jgi:hypothetical protein
MIRADLKANFLVALRHHQIAEPGGEDAPPAQMRNQSQGARGVAQQQCRIDVFDETRFRAKPMRCDSL